MPLWPSPTIASPTSASDCPGASIFEPVWAKDQSIRPAAAGIGYINTFDGTAWLRTGQALTLEGNVMQGSVGTTSLFYDVDVSSLLRTSAGLWLPGIATDDTTATGGFSGLVPTDLNGNSSALSVTGTTSSANSQLRDFQIPMDKDAKAKDGSIVTFLFSIPQGSTQLYTASVPNPSTDTLWYQHIVPWSFQLHTIISQRGGVSILNNVIDPDKAQTTTLQYTLTATSAVTVTVFDLSGAIVNVLVRTSQTAGTYEVLWGGTNRGGTKVARGIYFIRIVADGIDEIRKVLVVR